MSTLKRGSKYVVDLKNVDLNTSSVKNVTSTLKNNISQKKSF